MIKTVTNVSQLQEAIVADHYGVFSSIGHHGVVGAESVTASLTQHLEQGHVVTLDRGLGTLKVTATPRSRKALVTFQEEDDWGTTEEN